MRVASALWFARAKTTDAPMISRVRRLYRRMLRVAYRDPLTIADLAIDGEDLLAAGIRPGPLLGKILHALLERVLEDPARNTRDWLLQEALRLNGQWSGEKGDQHES